MFWVVRHVFPGQLSCSECLSVCRRISEPAHCRPPAFHFKPTFPINLTSSSQRYTSLRNRASALSSLKVANKRSSVKQTGTFTETRQLPRSESRCVRGMQRFCQLFFYSAAQNRAALLLLRRLHELGSSKSAGVDCTVFLGFSWSCIQLHTQRASGDVLLLLASSGSIE